MNTARHMDPVEDAGRHYEDNSTSQGVLFGQMLDTFKNAIREGRDEMLPSVSTRNPRAEGQKVSEWLSSCDSEQEAMLFNLLHLCLNKDNPSAIYEAANKFATKVAVDFADLYVESRL